jgi:Tfp pilus tip-associated adhesin PilY1
VIVEAPREAPNAKYSSELLTYQAQPSVRERNRAIYVFGNGYVHGFHGGTYDPTRTAYGERTIKFNYNDGAGGPAGTEIMRFAPNWIQTGDFQFAANDLIQQPLTTGQLTAREVRIARGGSYEFRTVLVGAQGKYGAGYFSLDVTDPCNPELIREWSLPGDANAAAEPNIYMIPRNVNDPDDRAVVITTSGADILDDARAAPNPAIFSHDIVTGALISQLNLPGPGSFPSAPICLDAIGEGRLTHCYVIRDDGSVFRVRINPNGQFGAGGGENAYSDITPPGVTGGGKRFTTSPAVFFDSTGSVNLVFGSGDFEDLTENGPSNNMYKIVDRSVRTRANDSNAQADISQVCGLDDGIINLQSNAERVISPPIVAKGVVAWTTYIPSGTGCIPGEAKIYAMNYLSCQDAYDGLGPPTPQDAGEGLPKRRRSRYKREAVA